MARIFRKRGLRRDRNFDDIPNSENSLNNLLDGLVQQSGERFVSADLNPIRNLSATTMSNEDFRNINNAAIRGIGDLDPEEVYRPIVTFQNRIDEIQFTTGDPQFFGGNKLTARYYLNEVINNEATTYDTVVNTQDAQTFLDDDGNETTTEKFWEDGQFTFFSDLHPSLDDGLGCVEWSGYFRPSISGRYFFRFNTTGLFTFEFNAHGEDTVSEASAFTTKKVVPQLSGVSVDLTNGSNSITINSASLYGESLINQISEGDTISAPFAPFDDPQNNPVEVTNVNYSAGQIQVSETYTGTSGTDSVDIISKFGQRKQVEYTTDVLERYQAYPIRLRFLWIDGFGAQYNPTEEASKTLNFFIRPPVSDLNEFNYKYLYSEDYRNFPEVGTEGAGDFYEFFVERVPPGGTRFTLDYQGSVGAESGFDGYRNLLSRDNIFLPYAPPKNESDAIFAKGMGYSGDGITLTTSNTDGLSVGNVVFGSVIDTDTIIESIIPNQGVTLNKAINTSSSGSGTFYFADHQGLKEYITGVYTDTASYPDLILGISDTNLFDVAIGDVVIAASATTSTTLWTRVIDIITSPDNAAEYAIQVSRNLDSDIPSSPQDFVLLYYSNSLEDRSLDTFCSTAIAANTSAFASAGDTTIEIENVRDYSGNAATITVGDYVYYGDRIPDSTTVTNISGSTITISNPISQEIPPNQVLAFSGVDADKGVCFRPRDTSPPFIATATGLRTTSTYPNMRVVSTNGELRFSNLSVGAATPVASTDGTEDSTSQIPIKDGSGTEYYILGKIKS